MSCWSEEPDLIERLQAEIAKLKRELQTIRNRTIEECARQAYNDATIEYAIRNLIKGD